MNKSQHPIKPANVRRQAAAVPKMSQLTVSELREGKTLPVFIEPAVKDVSLIAWGKDNRDLIESHLLRHGAILFRGFGISTGSEFDEFARAVSTEMAEYQEPATPRTHVSGGIYTSTDFPPAQRIFMHNENSHCPSWPLRLFFLCVTPADQGGETPIADSRRIYENMDRLIRKKFVQRQVMYVRNFGDGVALPWQAVFNTKDRAEMEAYCSKHRIEVTWKDENRLRIRYVRPAVTRHPRTGEMVWFNHVPLFHIENVEPEVREALLATFKEEDLPYNAYFGDGSRISASEMQEICEVYRREMVFFQWQPKDILMIDNMLTAHGREPYVGSHRRVLVGMAEPTTLSSVEQ